MTDAPTPTLTPTLTPTGVQTNYCDPSQNPRGSIAQWLANNQVDGSDCFEYEVIQACGMFNAQFTRNDTPYSYSFRYVLGSDTPDLANFIGTGSLPVNFTEDQNGGSVTLTYYAVGPEKDYFVGFGIPNIWDGNGATVVVDTDCEDEGTPTPTPTVGVTITPTPTAGNSGTPTPTPTTVAGPTK